MYNEYHQQNKYYEIIIKSDLLKLLTITAREYEELENSSDGEYIDRYLSWYFLFFTTTVK